MNQNMNNLNGNSPNLSSEAIDIKDILSQLWRGRIFILAVIIVTLVFGGLYQVFAKQKWTSSAVITIPDAGQITNYTNVMGLLYAQDPGNIPNVRESQQWFFNRLSVSLSALSQQLLNQEKPEKLTIESVKQGESEPLKISYTASSASAAQKTLTQYIQQINKRIVTEIDTDFDDRITAKVNDLQGRMKAKVEVAKDIKEKRLEVLNQALLVAQQANIKNTLVQQAETLSEDTLFVLGSDALSATIKNESTRPLPLDNSYYDTQQYVLALNSVKSNPNATYAFRYITKPEIPYHRDSPKASFIYILAAILGLIIGSAIVLVRNSLGVKH